MALFIPKDRKSLFRQFLAGMYDAVVITDPNGHILEINPRTVEYFGREMDEVLDQPVSIFIPGLKPEVVGRIQHLHLPALSVQGLRLYADELPSAAIHAHYDGFGPGGTRTGPLRVCNGGPEELHVLLVR